MIIDLTERKTFDIWTFCVKSNWFWWYFKGSQLLMLVPLGVNRTIFGTNCSNLCYSHLQQINYHENKRMASCVLTSNISAKTWSNWTCRGYFENVRTSRSVPGFEIWPRFVGVKEQNKICNSFCQYCKSIYQCSDNFYILLIKTRWNLF